MLAKFDVSTRSFDGPFLELAPCRETNLYLFIHIHIVHTNPRLIRNGYDDDALIKTTCYHEKMHNLQNLRGAI